MGGGFVSLGPNPSITVYQTVNIHGLHCLPQSGGLYTALCLGLIKMK